MVFPNPTPNTYAARDRIDPILDGAGKGQRLVKDAAEFFALDKLELGRYASLDGLAWDVVVSGGDFNHPITGQGIKAVSNKFQTYATSVSSNYGPQLRNAIETSSSGEIYLPAGNLTLDYLHINRSIRIYGEGRKKTKLTMTGGMDYEGHRASIVASGSDSEGLSSQMGISGMEIQITAPDTNGLMVMRKCTATEVHIRGAALNGILFLSGNPNTKAPYFNTFTSVWSKNNGKSGLRLSENCNANRFDMCQFDSNGEHGVRFERFGTPGVNQVLYSNVFTGGQASYNQMDGISLLHGANNQIYGLYTEYNSQIDGGDPRTGTYKNFRMGPTVTRTIAVMGEVGTDVNLELTFALNTVLNNSVSVGGRTITPQPDMQFGYENVGSGRSISMHGAGGCSHSLEFREGFNPQARLHYDGSPATPNNILALQTTSNNGASWNTLVSGLGNGRLGFYGNTPVAKQTVAPAATDADSTITLLNNLRTILLNLGLVQ